MLRTPALTCRIGPSTAVLLDEATGLGAGARCARAGGNNPNPAAVSAAVPVEAIWRKLRRFALMGSDMAGFHNFSVREARGPLRAGGGSAEQLSTVQSTVRST